MSDQHAKLFNLSFFVDFFNFSMLIYSKQKKLLMMKQLQDSKY